MRRTKAAEPLAVNHSREGDQAYAVVADLTSLQSLVQMVRLRTKPRDVTLKPLVLRLLFLILASAQSFLLHYPSDSEYKARKLGSRSVRVN